MSLIRSVHMGTTPVPDQTKSVVEAFLRSESPPPSVTETTEVPVFPRSSWPGLTHGSSMSSTKIPPSMSDLRFLAPTAQIEEEDLSAEHKRIMDGWSMCRCYQLLSRLAYQGSSGLPPNFIAISDSILGAGRYVKSGRRTIPSVTPPRTGGWRVYLGTRGLENG